MGDIGYAKSGVGFPDSEQGGQKGIPFFKVSDMNTNGNENELMVANNYVTDEQIARKHWNVIYDVPAIFFAKVGAAVMLNRKRLVRFPFLLDNNTMAYVFEKKVWNCDFGKTLFETIDLTKLTQVGALPSYNSSDIESIQILIPKFEEQTKIGQYFSQLDNLITLHQRECDQLKELKKSMLKKMFPRDESSIPEVRFAGFTDAWEQRKLGEIIEVNSGKDYKHLKSGNIPVYGTGGYMLSVNDALSFDKDAIGIGRKGTIDKPYILKSPFWTVDTLFYAIPKENYTLNFVFGIFQKIDWKSMDESTGVPSLSKATINNVRVSYPNSTEQIKIGQYFSQLDDLITLHQRELEILKNLKKTCLKRMFI